MVLVVAIVILGYELSTAGSPDISEFKDVGGGTGIAIIVVFLIQKVFKR